MRYIKKRGQSSGCPLFFYLYNSCKQNQGHQVFHDLSFEATELMTLVSEIEKITKCNRTGTGIIVTVGFIFLNRDKTIVATSFNEQLA